MIVPVCYNFWRDDYESVGAVLNSTCWRELFSRCYTVDEMYSTFIYTLHKLMEKFVPKRSDKKNEHLDKYIQKLEALLEKDFDPRIESKLRKVSTRLRIFEESNLNFKDSKSFFRYANKRLKGKELIGTIIDGDATITARIYCAFKNFSSDVYMGSHDGSQIEFRGSDQTNYLPSLVITEENNLAKINQLPVKCSLTQYLVPPLFYRKLAPF